LGEGGEEEAEEEEDSATKEEEEEEEEEVTDKKKKFNPLSIVFMFLFPSSLSSLAHSSLSFLLPLLL